MRLPCSGTIVLHPIALNLYLILESAQGEKMIFFFVLCVFLIKLDCRYGRGLSLTLQINYNER